MTVTVEPTTPSAVIDRVSLVLDAFDGPGRLTLAQIVRRTGLPGPQRTGCSSVWFSCDGCTEAAASTSSACG